MGEEQDGGATSSEINHPPPLSPPSENVSQWPETELSSRTNVRDLRFVPAVEMGLMAKNCCTIDMKSIWLRQLTHTIVEAFQQWWCFDEEKSVVQIAAAHELGGMEEALKGGNAFAVVHAVAVFSGRTESTSICENVFGLSAGLLRVTR